MKPFIVLVFLLGIGTGYCNAGTYTSKANPQHTVEYKQAVYLTVGQCQNYSRQKPGTVVSCWSMSSRHFYLDGEIVDDRMDQIAKDSGLETVVIFIFILLLIGIAIWVYMIPTIVAYNRQHPQRVFIMLLNLFLGNTGVGWIAALIWACGGKENK